MTATAGWLMTFHLFTVAAISFRSPELGTATQYFAKMFAFTGEAQLLTPFLLLLTAGAVAVQFLSGDGLERTAERMRNLPPSALGFTIGIGLLAIDFIGPDGVAPFVYFQF